MLRLQISRFATRTKKKQLCTTKSDRLGEKTRLGLRENSLGGLQELTVLCLVRNHQRANGKHHLPLLLIENQDNPFSTTYIPSVLWYLSMI